MKRRDYFPGTRWLALLLCLLLPLPIAAEQTSLRPPLPPPERLVPAYCEHVVDGDTAWFEVVEDGIPITHKVRFLNIDTPETVHPDMDVQPGGPEASAYVKAALEGQEVWLEYDIDRLDKYDRQLCHVWLKDGVLFNLRLLEEGFARVTFYEHNFRYNKFFIAAEIAAKAEGLGLWKSTNGK